MSGFELDRDVKRELASLRAEAAEQTAKHLVMVGRLIDTDPEAAHAHAVAARRLAPRLGLVREAVGLAAYHAGLFADALSELRAARRISGGDEHWPVLADCERALGRPERALQMAAAPEVDRLDRAGRVEMRIVAAGARADLGQLDAAVVTLQGPELNDPETKPWVARLRCAYAEALAEAGRPDEARLWFARAADADPEGLTPAAERLQEIDGVTFEFGEDAEDAEDEAAVDAEGEDPVRAPGLADDGLPRNEAREPAAADAVHATAVEVPSAEAIPAQPVDGREPDADHADEWAGRPASAADPAADDAAEAAPAEAAAPNPAPAGAGGQSAAPHPEPAIDPDGPADTAVDSDTAAENAQDTAAESVEETAADSAEDTAPAESAEETAAESVDDTAPADSVQDTNAARVPPVAPGHEALTLFSDAGAVAAVPIRPPAGGVAAPWHDGRDDLGGETRG